MTFSEYFNGLYKPLKNEEKKADFFDQMISHFIDEDACEGCTLLHVDSETKPRYAREKKPNPIKADNAKYLYARRNYNRGLSQFMVGKPLRGILKIAPKSGIMN